MPESKLWLLNQSGLTFTLGLKRSKFTQLENTWEDTVTIKRVSACHWCAWAVGHDHRVYAYVQGSDVPIRVSETTYENQVGLFVFLVFLTPHSPPLKPGQDPSYPLS